MKEERTCVIILLLTMPSEYIGFAQDVWDFVDEKSEVELINYINNKATQL
jgi:hypothetical protein